MATLEATLGALILGLCVYMTFRNTRPPASGGEAPVTEPPTPPTPPTRWEGEYLTFIRSDPRPGDWFSVMLDTGEIIDGKCTSRAVYFGINDEGTRVWGDYDGRVYTVRGVVPTSAPASGERGAGC